jgi:hypothetical protein
MQFARPAFARHPDSFGRAPARSTEAEARPLALGADLKLFAATFVSGFLFVSILIG